MLNNRVGTAPVRAGWLRAIPAAAAVVVVLLAAVPPAGCVQDESSQALREGRTSPMSESTISLPEATFRGLALEEALEQRRSVRRYSQRAMTQVELAQLLFAGQGVTETARGRHFRTAPSAGATYPMELYVAVNNVEGLERGIYRYKPRAHSVEPVVAGPVGESLRAACLGQEWLETAAAVMIITAVPDRIRRSYGDRSVRYIYMEAGHIAQNILLGAVSLGLAGVPIGAFHDGEVNRILTLDGKTEQVVYLISVGSR